MICELERNEENNKDAILCIDVYSEHDRLQIYVDAMIIVTDKVTMVFDTSSFTNGKIDTIIINPKVAILEDNNGKSILKVFT